MDYILASASPRRQELLKLITPVFSVIPADIDETVPDNIDIFSAPEFLAVQKARHIAALYPESLVVGADTSVFCDEIMLGKPTSDSDAANTLKMLSGRQHKVITGCAVCKGNSSISFSETTFVEFFPLSDKDIANYVKTGEPRDKAGAYGIQGEGAVLVKGIYGDYYNVVGLPVARLKREIDKFNKLF